MQGNLAPSAGTSVVSVGPAAAAPAAGSFPPLAPAELQRYQASFVQLDADRDGFVTVRPKGREVLGIDKG